VTDERDLLRAIPENPADDIVRLVYADWLTENGKPEYGDFIRVQVELAAVERRLVDLLNDGTDWDRCEDLSARWCPNCGECTCRNPEDSLSDANCPLHSPHSDHCCKEEAERKRDALCKRERELLIPNWGRWRPPVLSIMGDTIICRNIVAEFDDVPMPGDVVIEFRRGFVESVTCTLTAFLECAAELFRSQPVTTVVLTCREPEELLTGAGWMWRRGLSEDGGASSLPSELYGRLAKPVWHMRSVALEELSRVAIAYGRQLAGLTALPSPSQNARTRIPG